MDESLITLDTRKSRSFPIGWLVLGTILGSLITAMLMSNPIGFHDAKENKGNSFQTLAELASIAQAPANSKTDTPLQVINAFNKAGFWSDGSITAISWPLMRDTMGPYLSEDFVYEFIYPWVDKQYGVRGWYEGEFKAWNRGFPINAFIPFIQVSNSKYVSYASYMLSEWRGSFAGVPPINRTVRVRDLDFYLVQNGKIVYNWCMVDVVNLFQQAGLHVFPPASLPDDPQTNYLPPAVMDGLPAPSKAFVTEADSELAEKIVRAALQQDLVEFSNAASSWHWNMTWYGPAGIGTAHSRNLFVAHFLDPLHAAFQHPEMNIKVMVCEGLYCAALVYLRVLHSGSWLGQPASGRHINLRMGLHFRVEGNLIAESWSQIDLLSALSQMGTDPLKRIRAL